MPGLGSTSSREFIKEGVHYALIVQSCFSGASEKFPANKQGTLTFMVPELNLEEGDYKGKFKTKTFWFGWTAGTVSRPSNIQKVMAALRGATYTQANINDGLVDPDVLVGRCARISITHVLDEGPPATIKNDKLVWDGIRPIRASGSELSVNTIGAIVKMDDLDKVLEMIGSKIAPLIEMLRTLGPLKLDNTPSRSAKESQVGDGRWLLSPHYDTVADRKRSREARESGDGTASAATGSTQELAQETDGDEGGPEF